jgi:hypothetical protein
MMSEHSGSDIALEILIALREEVAPDLSEDLIRACYFVQRNNQFNSDPSVPVAEMEKLIDAEVERLSAKSEDQV